MDIEEEKEKLKRNYERALTLLDACEGLEDLVQGVGANTILSNYFETWIDTMAALGEFREKHGKYTLDSYYMSASGSIALLYIFRNGTRVNIYCRDVATALQAVGDGKCRVEEYTVTEKKIVCDL